MNPATPLSRPRFLPPLSPPHFRRRGRSPWILRHLALLATLSLAIAPPHASAQYMYLDSNNDGIHTAADVLAGTGTTQVDIWLRTDQNRDGTNVVCNVAPEVGLSLISYVATLRAEGGTVSFADGTNLQPTMSVRFANGGNETEYAIGYGGPSLLPPGTYRLARISVSVSTGTPSLSIVPRASTPFPDPTSFGSACYGVDFDNTLKLGSDWFDVDGLPYSAGGGGNPGPTIDPLGSIAGVTGEIVARDARARDADGSLVDMTLSAGPTFLSFTELSRVSGETVGRLHAWPVRGDEGSYVAALHASDGNVTADASVTVDVGAGPDHVPVLRLDEKAVVVAGTVRRVPLEAADFDGDMVSLALEDAPAFATLAPGASQPGHVSGALVLRPTICDVGDWTAAVSAVAAGARVTRAIAVRVLAPKPPPETLVRVYPSSFGAVAVGDFNEDGHDDIAKVLGSSLDVLLGDGAGAHTASGSYEIGRSYEAVAAGDWNGDGHLDLVAGSFTSIETRLLPGRGDGTFDPPVTITDAYQAVDFAVADFNRDGVSDLAVGSTSTVLTVLLGSAAGFTVGHQIHLESASQDIAVADFNLDGLLDLATEIYGQPTVAVFFGRGDGTFGDRVDVATPKIDGLTAGDFDRDGRPDLIAMEFNGGQIHLLRGDGAGGFSLRPVGMGPGGTAALETVDWNADGFEDVYAAGSDFGPSLFLLGDGTGSFTPFIPTGQTNSLTNVAFGDFNEDGRPDLAGAGVGLRTILNATATVTGVAARAFLPSDARVIPMSSSSATLSVRLEPVAATFDPRDVDPETVRLVSEGTGSVGSVSAIASKTATVGDTDRNEVDEYPVTFAMADVARLYDGLRGRHDVTPSVEGRLLDGMRFCSRLSLTIIAKGTGQGVARVDPNPLNPEGVLRFTTTRPSAVTVRLFDVNGRLVRTIWERRPSSAGIHEARIDGKDQQGRRLGSGVYFYRIQGDDLEITGRFTVLK